MVKNAEDCRFKLHPEKVTVDFEQSAINSGCIYNFKALPLVPLSLVESSFDLLKENRPTDK